MHDQISPRDERIMLRPERHPRTVLTAGFAAPSQRPESTVDLASSRLARSIIQARALRRRFFDGEMFSDPAWDILLELYALKCEQVRISVSKLSVAAGVPATTALRWIDKLEADGLVVRCDDPFDGRRNWVELSDSACNDMRSYLAQVSFAEAAL